MKKSCYAFVVYEYNDDEDTKQAKMLYQGNMQCPLMERLSNFILINGILYGLGFKSYSLMPQIHRVKEGSNHQYSSCDEDEIECKFWDDIEGIEFIYADLHTKHTQTVASFLGSNVDKPFAHDAHAYLQHAKRPKLLLSEFHETITFQLEYNDSPCFKAISEDVFAIVLLHGCSYIKIDFSLPLGPLDIAFQESEILYQNTEYFCHQCGGKIDDDELSDRDSDCDSSDSDDDDINSVNETLKWYICNMPCA